MAILNFQKPDRVYMVNSSDTFGQFEFRPLEPGYGLTVGNALRRVLLSSLEGFAISSIKIEGIEHEFSTIDGMVEDITEVILNLKQVRFKIQVDDVEDELVKISISPVRISGLELYVNLFIFVRFKLFNFFSINSE